MKLALLKQTCQAPCCYTATIMEMITIFFLIPSLPFASAYFSIETKVSVTLSTKNNK